MMELVDHELKRALKNLMNMVRDVKSNINTSKRKEDMWTL
jgi:hypothetical protein